VLVLTLVLGAILLGCAAYEAGNILGGVAGALLAIELPPRVLALLSGLIAAALLWFQAPRTVARMLSLVVALMGVAFLVTAWRIGPSLTELLRGSLVPILPSGSGLLALGLVGTTVVPYNIFLGSGLAGGQELRDLRLGLAIAIGLGGVISMGVLVVGTAVTGPFDFASLAEVLAQRLGARVSTWFGLGLLGAGLSSAITAPLAAAITARDLFQKDAEDKRWSESSWRYRAVWLAVLLTGLVFGLSAVQPIPAIILAQAFNGLVLPLVAVFLFLAVNDSRLMKDRTNGNWSNAVMGMVVLISLLLGVSALGRAVTRVLGRMPPEPFQILIATAVAVAFSGEAITRRAKLERSSRSRKYPATHTP
jgi:Mn2+/Fe2+ NRAMP family transporter